MRILFDHNVFNRAPHSGVSRYISAIAAGLASVHNVDARVFAPFHTNHFLSKSKTILGHHHLAPSISKLPSLYTRLNEVLLGGYRFNFKPDILHETHFSGRCYRAGYPRIVYTAHDFTPELFPQYFKGFSKVLERRKMAFGSDSHFVAVSHWTKRDLVRVYGVDERRIRVIHHGIDVLRASQNIARRDDQLLYVGARGGYKDFQSLLGAFRRSNFLAQNIELKIFGGPKPSYQELASIDRAKIKRFCFEGGDDDALARAYQEATLFVYPSLYEGFGLPILEAMSLGCPVACSNASCFPEIGGSAAAYFDAGSEESIADVLTGLLLSRSQRENLRQSGEENQRRFSWTKSVGEHLNYYHDILNGSTDHPPGLQE